jgi:hypothetical protein
VTTLATTHEVRVSTDVNVGCSMKPALLARPARLPHGRYSSARSCSPRRNKCFAHVRLNKQT